MRQFVNRLYQDKYGVVHRFMVPMPWVFVVGATGKPICNYGHGTELFVITDLYETELPMPTCLWCVNL